MRHLGDEQEGFDRSRRQFGIRQLIIVTAVIGVALGIGRAFVAALGENVNLDNHETPIFVLLAVAAILVSLPLMLAVLMRPLSVVALTLAGVFIVVVTALELPALRMLPAGGPEMGHFISINTFTVVTILPVLVMVRRCGYSLIRV